MTMPNTRPIRLVAFVAALMCAAICVAQTQSPIDEVLNDWYSLQEPPPPPIQRSSGMIITHPSAVSSVVISNSELPSWVYGTTAGDSYLIGGWIRRDALATTAYRSPVFIQNNSAFRVSSAAIQFRLNTDTASTSAQVTPGGDFNDQWVFVLASVDKGNNLISLCAKGEFGRLFNQVAGNFASGTHTAGDFVVARNCVAGAGNDGGGNTYPQWYGPIACICVKNIQLSTQATLEAIVDAIYAEANPNGLLDYRGNGLSGIDDDYFAINCTVPQDLDTNLVAGATDGARMGSTIVGGANANYTWLGNGVDAYNNDFNMARPVTVTGTLTFDDANEPEADFFGPALPGITTNGVNGVNLSIGRRLYDENPTGIERIWVISNSRGMRNIAYDADGDSNQTYHNYPGSHAHGFVGAKWASCAGYMNAYINYGIIVSRFGFDCDVAPYKVGTAEWVHGTAYQDFQRAGSNQGNAVATGPGRITRLAAGATLAVRVRDTPGSLLTKDKATTVAVRYLNYPAGTTGFSWTGITHTSQGGAGTSTGQSDSGIEYDTTQATRTFGGTDSYTSGTKTLQLDPDLSAVQVGWLCYISSGTGAGSIAEVTSVTGSGPTTIVLKHVFGTGPGAGSVLRFGPYSYSTVSVTLAARSAEYGGMNITNGAAGNLMLVSCDVVTDDAAGWVFGEGGWGGNGYGLQLAAQFTGSFGMLSQSLGANAVFMFNATQSATTADRKAVADAIAAYHPGVKIAYCGDQMHDVTDDGSWQTESLSQSSYAAVVATEDARLGDTLTQFATGQKANVSHPSIEGMILLAQATIDQMVAWENLPEPGIASVHGRLTRDRRLARSIRAYD